MGIFGFFMIYFMGFYCNYVQICVPL